MRHNPRAGAANKFYLTLSGALVILSAFAYLLYDMGRPARSSSNAEARKNDDSEPLVLYCAAGIRPPVEQIAADYQKAYDVPVQLQYGGSNTLLSQIEVAKTGDLYLAADDSYTRLAQAKGLVEETIPLAKMRPVIAVKKGNPKQIRGVKDLLRDDVKTALGNPGQAAIGKKTRKLLQKSGHWEALEKHVTDSGVFKPTVPEVANDIKLGSVDAGVVWDTTLALYPGLEAIRTPELDAGEADVTIGVLKASASPTKALRFARFLASRDKGLLTFKDKGFETVDGDKWSETPELTFFCGSVNRRSIGAVLKAFEKREGVKINTIYNGCGILTAQMRTIRDQEQGSGFPDTYMACDRYYLETVKDWFQEDVDVSDTRVVIAVPKGNPRNIQSLQDLTKPGVRVSVGQPDQCTIGVLTKKLLESEGVYDAVMKNVVTQPPSSAMLVPTVATRSVDATLAFATDTRAESDKVETIRVDSLAAMAIQPFAIARSSNHKHLARRLYNDISNARERFAAAGFHFRLDDDAEEPTKTTKK